MEEYRRMSCPVRLISTAEGTYRRNFVPVACDTLSSRSILPWPIAFDQVNFGRVASEATIVYQLDSA